METDKNLEQHYIRAKKRVENIKKFYKHLASYIIVNTFISGVFIFGAMQDGVSFTEALLRKSTFIVWFFWGIGLVLDAIKTFGVPSLFNKDWEDKKIKEYLNNQKI